MPGPGGLRVLQLNDAVEAGQRYGPALIQIKALVSPVAIAATTSAEQALTVTGLAAGDIIVAVNKPTHQAGIIMGNGRVSAANTWQIIFGNWTTAAITPTAAQTYDLLVMRPAI